MAIQHLAEAIILQSIEDLWDVQQRKYCVAFFEGEGFHLCAGTAGITMFHRRRLLKLISTSIRCNLDCMESRQEDAIEYSLGGR
jgi:hypothetical protein